MRFREGISVCTEPGGRALPVSPRYHRRDPRDSRPGISFCAIVLLAAAHGMHHHGQVGKPSTHVELKPIALP